MQLASVKERLEAAKAGSTRGIGSPTGLGGFSFTNAGSRIAKPLRGGGGGTDNTAANPAISNLQSSDNKRSSVSAALSPRLPSSDYLVKLVTLLTSMV